MIFYKAVRPDGTDFRTGTVDYAALCGTDEWLPELPGGRCCTAGVYHASTSKADTLIGGEWPCRLFEIEGEPVSQEGNKRGFRTLKVMRELPAWQALGPNGETVAALIDQANRLTREQANRLYVAWATAWAAAQEAAWGAAWAAAEHAAREAAEHAAGHAAWAAAREAAGHVAENAAGHAAGAAARALVVRDLITEDQFHTLARAWISVMGEI